MRQQGKQQHARGLTPALMGGVCAIALCGWAAASPALAEDAAIATHAADGSGSGAAAAQAETAPTPSTVQEVVVTGVRKSLRDAANAKRSNTGFTDSIFAEDIGKFPDLNLAEAVNRIPGVTISRDIDGEGVNISIRGLGTNFTKILLNGSQIAVASDGGTDSGNSNREVDLDMFPTELFTKLTVYKSAYASVLEGGSSGSLDMVNARPFDNPGQHLTYTFQDGYAVASKRGSPRGAIIASKTWGDKFGVLVGVAGAAAHIRSDGFETIGWTTPNLNNATNYPGCFNGSTFICDNVGQNGAAGGAGFTFGAGTNQATLLANNPGMTLQQISDTLFPRLGRESMTNGHRNRLSFLTALEFRPTSDLKFNFDGLYGMADRDFNRLDMDWVVRNSGAMLPSNMQVDSNGVLTKGTFANSQFFLEARPWHETLSFLNLNPSMSWKVNDWLKIDGQVNWNRSVFFRHTTSYLFNTPANITVNYDDTSGDIPEIKPSANLDDPNLGWQWNRLNIQNNKRITQNKGTHWIALFGDNVNNIKVGFAYDDVFRNIKSFDNSGAFQSCTTSGTQANVQTANGQLWEYPCSGALVPNSALPGNFIVTGPAGNFFGQAGYSPGFSNFIGANYPALNAATNYAFYSQYAPFAGSSSQAVPSGSIEEKTTGGYLEANGKAEFLGRPVRFNGGVRYFSTDQAITGPITLANQGGVQVQVYSITPTGGKKLIGTYTSVASAPSGQPAAPGCTIPGIATPTTNGCPFSLLEFQTLKHTYNAFLPSFNVAVDLRKDLILRLAGSRTVTRPNPNVMLPGTTFTDPSAQIASQGNPNIAPYFSNNFDIGLEWYTGGAGYLALDVFNKSINGFTQNGQIQVPFSSLGIPQSALSVPQQQIINSSNPNPMITVNTQTNAPGTLIINGVEVNYVRPLDFLTKGLGVTANYTHVDQSSSGQLPPATGIARYTYNLGGYYENHGLSVHVTYVYQDRRIIATAPQNNVYLPLGADPYGQVDMSASYTLPWWGGRTQLTLNATNLNNEGLRTYFGHERAVYNVWYPGPTYLFGFRGRF